jgi:hypothetical protein
MIADKEGTRVNVLYDLKQYVLGIYNLTSVVIDEIEDRFDKAEGYGYAKGYTDGHADGLREGLDDNPDRGSSVSPKRKRKVKT